MIGSRSSLRHPASKNEFKREPRQNGKSAELIWESWWLGCQVLEDEAVGGVGAGHGDDPSAERDRRAARWRGWRCAERPS